MDETRHELLLGCGHSRDKRIYTDGNRIFVNLTTVDINKDTKPDLLLDMDSIVWLPRPLNKQGASAIDAYGQFKSDYFQEVHAYEVLEHCGHQGDAASFFGTFHLIWRLLRHGGYLCATTPSRYSGWLWGDPGHTRAILPESLVFLDQTNYAQCGKTAMSDYRYVYTADFRLIQSADDKITHSFILQAIKPARKI